MQKSDKNINVLPPHASAILNKKRLSTH